MVIQTTIPILRIFDVQKAKDFYVGFLGFTVDWEHHYDEKSPAYMQVTRDGLTLHLSEHHGDCCPGSTVFVWMTGLEEFHREITSKGYGYLRPGVETTFYDAKCMEVIDPFGNRIRFNEKLKKDGTSVTIQSAATEADPSMLVILETPRLLLRQWTNADEEPLHAICSDPLVMRFVGEGERWPRERTRAFVEDAIATEREFGFCRWPLIFKEREVLIGFCGFVPTENGAEIGWRLASQHWGRGLATEAANAVLKFGFETLGFNRVTATVQSGNAASLRIVEKLGMEFVEEFVREGRDVLRFAVVRYDRRNT